MSRDIILSNGDLTVGLDGIGQVQTLYYPSTAQGNHVGQHSQHHKIGLYCEDAVHWLDDGAWKVKKQLYYPGRLISQLVIDNLWLDIRLEIQDYVDYDLDILVRNIHVINLSGRKRQAKLFVHQNFAINDNVEHQDTAQYIPAGTFKGLDKPVVTHYYGDKAFVITGQSCLNQAGFDEFSIGHFGKYDNQFMAGVWCDAADGILSGNPHETGQTDSIIGFDLRLAPHDSCYVNYYLSAGDSVASAGHNLQRFLHEGISMHTKKTSEHWLEWVQPAVTATDDVEKRIQLANLLVTLRSQMNNDGALQIIGSSDKFNGLTNAPLVKPISSSISAFALAKSGLDIDAGRVFDFYNDIVGRDHCLYPAYLDNGYQATNLNAYLADDNGTILPIAIGDSAIFVLMLCLTIRTVSTRTVPADWRKRWTKLGKPLADFLTDYVDPLTKLPRPSYHHGLNGHSSPALDKSDIAITYIALSEAASLSEKVKDMSGTIKYQTAADDMRESMQDETITQSISDPSSTTSENKQSLVDRLIESTNSSDNIVRIAQSVIHLVDDPEAEASKWFLSPASTTDQFLVN